MKIGMVGGIGPESTADYYRRLIALYRQEIGGDDYPEIVIDSINMTAMLRRVAAQSWDTLASMLSESVAALHRAGAGLAFIASNTPHIVFEQVRKDSPVPLVSIVEAARSEAERRGVKRIGLLGTLLTMESGYYQAELEKSGIEAAVPNKAERRYIEEKLFSEIEQGVFLNKTRAGLLKIVKRLIDKERIDGVILGCTELPLILTRDEFGIPFLNTTQIHVRRVLDAYVQMSRAQHSAG
jgi:aspartate racemase